MRSWYKYFINYNTEEKIVAKDASFADHKKSMEGYSSAKGYGSKEDFFRTHFLNAHPRHRYYHDYLRTHLNKADNILSIGSGRCVNELLLAEEGFSITCSDLEQPCMGETARLFPGMRFMKYDVTKGPVEDKFDSIICLSIFYLFDKTMLAEVFRNVSDSLKPGGSFIVDPCGAENNVWTRIIDDIICPLEMVLIMFLKRLTGKRRCIVTKKHQGYRTTNAELTAIAGKAGFRLRSIEKYDHFTEFGMRSNFFSRLPKGIVRLFGRGAPYVRMISFEKNLTE
ncbi:MAG: class I SAM-dependent methyltransferase [Candidatus Omnitrophota bacterium]